ncbi:hypothetical protein F3K34_44130 [Streptomyces sp. LBUM 1486]|uniref:hypothetical protein n=1 Tax=Streptomyces scabiei TaxID=1930 RepID=UPI001B32D660|nr:hypothetical protein [Streptomyces sp. LBUM 1486]MBP5918774.1 hypothetical protein [Streptomyces sp. LBUM 1486]
MAGTTIDATLVTTASSSRTPTERTLIRVTNTAGHRQVVTVKAGSGTQAGWPDRATPQPRSQRHGKEFLGPFTSARFQQDASKLYVDFAAGTTGTIIVFKLPKAF